MAPGKAVAKDPALWHKPPTRCYEDNYAYGINFYQPMIDYLNAKAEKKARVQPPHLPWSNERGLEKYNTKIVRAYSESDLKELAKEAEEQAKRDLKTFTISKKSNFSLSKSVSASTVTKKIALVGTVDRKKIKQRHQQRSMENLDDAFLDEQIYESNAKKFSQEYLMGKSAKAIEAHLLADSLRNESSNTSIDIKAFQRRSALSTHNTREHERMMDTRRQIRIDEEELTKPLDNLRADLVGFNKKTSTYYQDKCKQTVNTPLTFMTNPRHLYLMFA